MIIACVLLGKADAPKPDELVALLPIVAKPLDPSIIAKASNTSLFVFKAKGATEKIAKGSEMLEEILKRLEKVLEKQDSLALEAPKK